MPSLAYPLQRGREIDVINPAYQHQLHIVQRPQSAVADELPVQNCLDHLRRTRRLIGKFNLQHKLVRVLRIELMVFDKDIEYVKLVRVAYHSGKEQALVCQRSEEHTSELQSR